MSSTKIIIGVIIIVILGAVAYVGMSPSQVEQSDASAEVSLEGTPADAAASETAPTDSTPSEAAPAEAEPAEAATPSEATPSP